MKKRKRKISLISGFHYAKLLYRSLLLILAAIMYIISNKHNTNESFKGYEKECWLLGIIWIVYTIEMACRFFPSKLESMGCQKQFKRNFEPTGEDKPQLQSWKKTFTVVLAWLALNGILGILYFTDVIDEGFLVLTSLFYGVCDMICILFFCPFQTWIMKNRCCNDCRIYNWDFAMMFTPFVFIPNGYTWSLLALSLALLLRWEIALKIHPERFSEKTNACISCKNCEEKLCHHKTQLRALMKKMKLAERKIKINNDKRERFCSNRSSNKRARF